MPAILWPDAEAVTLDYLRPLILTAPFAFAAQVKVRDNVTTRATDGTVSRPDYAVTVRNDGGPIVGDVRATARLGVNVWAPTKAEAVDLANYVAALVGGMAEANVTPAVRSTTSVPYAVPDDSGQPHMYFTAELVLRGTNI